TRRVHSGFCAPIAPLNLPVAPHPVPLPLRGGEGARRAGEGWFMGVRRTGEGGARPKLDFRLLTLVAAPPRRIGSLVNASSPGGGIRGCVHAEGWRRFGRAARIRPPARRRRTGRGRPCRARTASRGSLQAWSCLLRPSGA